MSDEKRKRIESKRIGHPWRAWQPGQLKREHVPEKATFPTGILSKNRAR